MRASSLQIVALSVLLLTCTVQRPAVGHTPKADPRWARIDSLDSLGQYASALTLSDGLLLVAQAQADWRTEFRAWMYTGRLLQLIDDEAWPTTLARMEARTVSAPFPLAQLLHSTIGEFLWSRYQEDRWMILERTNTSDDPDDPLTWGQQAYITRIITHYQASISPYDSLRATPVRELGPLLIGDARAQALRPTLFDLLAHRALAVFTNSETRIAEPTWRFKLDDARHFGLFEDFAYRRIEHRDSAAWEFQALRLYQLLERSHLSDNDPGALVDVALARLNWVHAQSTLEDKDSLHLHALELLRTRLPNDSCWSEVTLALARWHERMGARYDRLASDAWKWERYTANALCDSAIARFPGSFGALNAANLKARLHDPSLELRCEVAVSPELPFKVAVEYHNTAKVWLRLVRPLDESGAATTQRVHDAGWLLQQEPLHEWSVDLPDDGDLNEHLVELPVDALPPGRFALILCNAPTFAAGTDVIAHAELRATRLAVVERQEANRFELLVLDRWTGWHRTGVQVEAFTQRWTSGKLVADKFAERMTDRDGRAVVEVPSGNGQVFFTVTDGDDLLSTGAHYHYQRGGPGAMDSLRTFLFTDRAIYRPGQEVLFKGIVTVKRGGTTATKAGHRTIVRFFDVNGQFVDSVNVTTDPFGSFQGRFKAPTGALTGHMRLVELHGSRGVQVEEYKRPTFELVFDPIEGQPMLDRELSVTGRAKSYAGVSLDGAEVRWTVKRGARMPWWCVRGWYGLPWGRETEIASGTGTCDAEGKFTLTFIALADHAFPRDADPSFQFTIEASATDISGETRQGSTGLTLAHRSIDLDLGPGGAIDRNGSDSLRLRVLNLMGQAVDVPVDVRITRLRSPVQPLRDRLWDRPDRFVLSSEEHAQRFPQEAYGTEDDPLNWSVANEVLVRNAWHAATGPLRLEGLRNWEVGNYRIEATARDEAGREVKVRKVFTVYDTGIQRSGFAHKTFHVEAVQVRAEPGTKAVLLPGTTLPECRILMEIERGGRIVASKWFTLNARQQRVELPVLEDDRGGFFVHFVCVERGRMHRETIAIDVPWSNKDLQVQWMSFRDKMRPGDEEEWRLKISGPKGEKVAAQLLAAMYDASLDQFVTHDWAMSVWPAAHASMGWSNSFPFGMGVMRGIDGSTTGPVDIVHHYPWLKTYGLLASRAGGRVFFYREKGNDEIYLEERFPLRYQAPLMSMEIRNGPVADQEIAGMDKTDLRSEPPLAVVDQPIRTDFRETAFFFPGLLTDRDGNVMLRFKTPDALTRWKVLGLAHTTDLRLAQFAKEAITQKPLMVVPNLPRFLRSGDAIMLTVKINVLEEGRAEGLVALEFFDPFTNKAINRSFGVQVKDQVFIAAKGESAVASWRITVPEGVDAAGIRITASSRAGPLSTLAAADGEERVLPILTDKVLVTESLPFWTGKAGTRTFTLEKLKSNTSTTLEQRNLKLEYTPNPAWHAVQALPYLMEFPHECAEQVFARYYANRIAAHIVAERPAIRKVLEEWRKAGPDAFASNLEKNDELKNVLLEETPWVVNARSDRERKERVALLFDLERMSNEEATALKKLRDMQLSNGAWPWWSGMRESRWITQHIVAGLGHLERLGAAELREDGEVQRMLERAVQWLDAEMERDHKRLLKEFTSEERAAYRPGYAEIHHLYARSFLPRWPMDAATSAAAQFHRDRMAGAWSSYGLQEQTMIALVLRRMDDRATAQIILGSLRERATVSEDLGMYWKGFSRGMGWNELPTETHALLIEAFHEVADDDAAVSALRTHLLALKRSTDWRTTKATAEACYALLLRGGDWLAGQDAPAIKVGGEELKDVKKEAGTGFFEKSWSAGKIGPSMGEVTVTTTSDHPTYGALHWQYLEQMDKVTTHPGTGSPFSIKRQVMLTSQTDQGTQLSALDKVRKLKPGDKLTIRIELRTDRWSDFVHLKDLRAAGLEPIEALSGYRYQGGLGYYQSIRDASMNFFFDRIAPGTYVFEYALRVTHGGDFSNGITTAMCMYAPEFSSHSEGLRITIGEP